MLIFSSSAAVIIGVFIGILGIIVKGRGKDELGAKIAYIGIVLTSMSMIALIIVVIIAQNFLNPNNLSPLTAFLFNPFVK